jgi:hypothetical protein
MAHTQKMMERMAIKAFKKRNLSMRMHPTDFVQ